MPWKFISCSEIGTKNKKLKKVCQDCADYIVLSENHTFIGAVADGMGSAKHSEKGAKLATEVTISELKREGLKTDLKDPVNLQRLFESILETVNNKFEKMALSRNYRIEDLACTLLAFIATPEWLAAMQVGDGMMVVRSPDESYQLLFNPDKGEYDNETTPVVSSNASSSMQVCFRDKKSEFICVATDGFENIALRRAPEWEPFENFFEPLRHHLLSSKQSIIKKNEIRDFLKSEKVNEKTSDDKTLLICAYE